jgi:ubiquinone/menaquinone biosynthesis C-methylase UbiE
VSTSGTSSHYAISGGVSGRERLRVLARTMQPTTTALFDRLQIAPGLSCLDVGCGGGDVTLELARRVGPGGKVLGTDIDETKLEIARAEADAQGVRHAEYRNLDVRQQPPDASYDIVYARFLLSHLPDPAGAAATFHQHLRPGGVVIVEDIDFRGCFVCPDIEAYWRYHALYREVVRRRGGNAEIGPLLPGYLREAGFADVDMHVVQPAGMQRHVKLMITLTMENIADAVFADGLATRDEFDATLRELQAFVDDPLTVAGLPRIVQAWGRRPV